MLRNKLTKLLLALLGKLNRKNNQSEYIKRLDFVRSFLHEMLPTLDEFWKGKAIIEGGTFNYFQLPSGKLPNYSFVLPEIPLYIVVSGIESASWDEARQRGISRSEWETAKLDLAYLIETTENLSTLEMAARPKVVHIKWNEPINHLILAEKIGSKV